MKSDLKALLLSMRDESYAKFQRKLMPCVAPERVIGVRIPALRRLARQSFGSKAAVDFLSELPHALYDEDNLHGALLDLTPDFDTAIHEVERFLPYIDNWATCDLFCPKILLQKPDCLLSHIKSWLLSGKVYTVRYGLVRLTSWYLDGARFTPEILSLAAQVRGEDYYINMAQAWFFSMALAKQYDATIPYFTEQRLDTWVHNKAIQKAVESYQVSPETKAYLKTLKCAVKGEPT